MINQFTQLLLLSLFGGVLALFFSIVFLYNTKLYSFFEKYSLSFASGVLISFSLFVLFPEISESNGKSTLFIIPIFIFLMFLLEKYLLDIHHHPHPHKHYTKKSSSSVIFILIGDTIHNFVDGIAIGTSFVVSPAFGLVTAFSSFLHEVPHEIGDFGIMLDAKWKKSSIVVVNIISALFTTVGAFTIYYINPQPFVIGYLLCFSAAMFLYIGLVDLIPKIEKTKEKLYSFLVGFLIPILTTLIL